MRDGLNRVWRRAQHKRNARVCDEICTVEFEVEDGVQYRFEFPLGVDWFGSSASQSRVRLEMSSADGIQSR